MADIAQAASPTDTFGQRQETYRECSARHSCGLQRRSVAVFTSPGPVCGSCAGFGTEQFIMQRNVSVANLAAGTFNSVGTTVCVSVLLVF